jgi:hypothetical protein
MIFLFLEVGSVVESFFSIGCSMPGIGAGPDRISCPENPVE